MRLMYLGVLKQEEKFGSRFLRRNVKEKRMINAFIEKKLTSKM